MCNKQSTVCTSLHVQVCNTCCQPSWPSWSCTEHICLSRRMVTGTVMLARHTAGTTERVVFATSVLLPLLQWALQCQWWAGGGNWASTGPLSASSNTHPSLLLSLCCMHRASREAQSITSYLSLRHCMRNAEIMIEHLTSFKAFTLSC